MIRLGWFVSQGGRYYGWNTPWAGNVSRDIGRPELFTHNAKTLENAGFDYVMLEDASVIPDVHRGSPDYSLRRGLVRFDPFPFIPLMAQATRHIGLIATMATTFYPPYIAARLASTLDHLTEGRFGLNLVTASPHAAAQNFGYDQHFEHDLRYRMADEWVQAVTALWDSWDDDALVLDEDNDVFADPSKVRYADFAGEFYRTRGPLNVPPGPQHRPVLCQAGGSGAGRAFAARHADTVIAAEPGIEQMRAYKQDISAKALEAGRDPEKIRLMHLISPILADTVDEAQAKAKAGREAYEKVVEDKLAGLAYISGFDFSQFDLDEPLPDIDEKVNGHKSAYAIVARMAKGGRTLREVLVDMRGLQTVDLIGTPESVADEMIDVMAQVGGDGYLIELPFTRRNVAEIADGLAPALRRRGALRDGYPHATFRENLLDD